MVNVMVTNITWNPHNWQKQYIDPKASHSYAREFPGHESLNFLFNKDDIDDDTYIFGYSQWSKDPSEFINGGYVIFYTRNYHNNKTYFVGIYGDVEILNPLSMFNYNGFEENILLCNMKAKKNLSLLFPYPLNAKNYKYENRMVGQVGFKYYDENLVKRILEDEYKLIDQHGEFVDESLKMNNLFFRLTKKQLFDKNLFEQGVFEKIEFTKDKSDIINELRNLKETEPEQIVVSNKTYKRDNKTIAQLKIIREYKCQLCSTTITKSDGSSYIEAAHITPKCQKGAELPNNILILCPNHHKEFDLGKKEIIERTDENLVIKLNNTKYEIYLGLDLIDNAK